MKHTKPPGVLRKELATNAKLLSYEDPAIYWIIQSQIVSLKKCVSIAIVL
jgi:hypothetical protein